MKCSGPGFNPQHHPNEPEHTDNSTHKQNWTVGKTHPEASIEGYVITPLWFWIWTRLEHLREHQSVSISNLNWHPPISCPRWTKLKPSFTGMSLLHPAAIQQWLSMFIMNSGHDTHKLVTSRWLWSTWLTFLPFLTEIYRIISKLLNILLCTLHSTHLPLV